LFVSPDAFLRDGLEYSSEGQQWLQPMSAPGTVPFRRPVIKSFRDEEIGKGLETRVLQASSTNYSRAGIDEAAAAERRRRATFGQCWLATRRHKVVIRNLVVGLVMI
jgi:hypothetical protein